MVKRNAAAKSNQKLTPPRAASFLYDACLSFAGEDRNYVEKVANHLRGAGLNVFYDVFEETNLWGKDLYEHLDYVYSKSSRFCIVFCSKHYEKKLWTNHERKSAQARAFEENSEYILPVRFDNTEIPGIRQTIGYLDAKRITPAQLAIMVLNKLRPRKAIELQHRTHYLPIERDILIRKLGTEDPNLVRAYDIASYGFFEALSRMTSNERFIILSIFVEGCPHNLPDDVHISFDLLKRITKLTAQELLNELAGLGSLGFSIKYKGSRRTKISSDPAYVYLQWQRGSPELSTLTRQTNFTGVAYAMIEVVTNNYCKSHGMQKLINLNFSDLSTADKLTIDWCASNFNGTAEISG